VKYRWLLIFGVASISAGLAAQNPTPISDADLAGWVDKRVQERQPPAADKRFDEIGWAHDIRHAVQLAKEHNRPVFLFTLDGRMNLGRC
jgi:hypothetical protein